MHVGLGFVMAYLSLVPPGMLNMTAVRTAIEKGSHSGRWFSLGAALVVIPQAFLALVFAKFFESTQRSLKDSTMRALSCFLAYLYSSFCRPVKSLKAKGKNARERAFGWACSCRP